MTFRMFKFPKIIVTKQVKQEHPKIQQKEFKIKQNKNEF